MAGALRLLILLVPIGASFAATVAIRRLVPEPSGGVARALWWVALVVSAIWVAVIVERGARRLLPLVTLLKLGMLFPDRAPSRFAIAREAGSTRRLEERLRQLEDDPGAANESSSARTILALIVALQNHDRKTRGHAERVRVYTDLLAEELHLPAEDRYRLRWAALLHDIGKLSVKARILNKPGALDAREWDDMHKHPAEGARIAGSLLGWLGPWGLAISQHHERIDGAGYPAAMPGDRISIAARIVSVADAYDTMTGARTYRKPLAVRAARQELADCAGTQFDREIVRAFFAISLPRLLWKTGPVSLLFHLPYLRQLEAIGQQSLAAAGHTVTAATIAASVTAMSVGVPLSASAATPVRSDAVVSISASSHDHARPRSSEESPDVMEGLLGSQSATSVVEGAPAEVSMAGVAGSRGDSDSEAEPPEASDEEETQGGDDVQGDDGRTDDSNGQSEDPHGQSEDPHGQSEDSHGRSDEDHGKSDEENGNGNGNDDGPTGNGNDDGSTGNGDGTGSDDGSTGNGNDDGSTGNGNDDGSTGTGNDDGSTGTGNDDGSTGTGTGNGNGRNG